MSGVIGGMGMKWDLSVDPTTTSSSVIAKGFHRVAIDGEILEFYANLDSTVGGFVSDTTANPFGSAAAANWNKPYYIYAVGGRHAPMPSFNTSDKILSPVTLVESTVAPVLSTQRPSAALTVNGVTVPVTGAVYVGLGFVVFNSTRRAGCIMDESFTYPGTANSIIGVPNALTRAAASSAFEAFDGNAPAVVPAISRRAKVIVVAPASATVVGVSVDNGAGSAVSPGFLGASAQLVVESSAAPQAFLNGEIEWPAGAVPPKIWVSNSAGAGTTGLFFRGFDHGVRIFNGQVNP
jgi:hypothetical protein